MTATVRSITLVFACLIAALAAAPSTAGAADWDDLSAAWRAGDIAAARSALADLDAEQRATPAGVAWTQRLADDPSRLDLLRSDDRAAHLDAAWIAWGKGDREDAASHLSAARSGEGETLPGIDFLAGLLARRNGEQDTAREALASVKPDDPSFAWARYTLGRIAAVSGDAALARRYYDNADDAAAPVCRADVLAATWELVRGTDPRQALRLERELANRFPESLPLIRVRELGRRRLAVETSDADAPLLGDDPAAGNVHAAGETVYTLQLGAFGERSGAEAFRDQWRDTLDDLEIVSGQNDAGRPIHRIRTGSFPTRQRAADRAEELLREHGLTSLVTERKPGS